MRVQASLIMPLRCVDTTNGHSVKKVLGILNNILHASSHAAEELTLGPAHCSHTARRRASQNTPSHCTRMAEAVISQQQALTRPTVVLRAAKQTRRIGGEHSPLCDRRHIADVYRGHKPCWASWEPAQRLGEGAFAHEKRASGRLSSRKRAPQPPTI